MNTEKLKCLRDEYEITQKEMADVLNCTRSAYSLWEINQNVIPLYYLNKIANKFDVNIDYLVDLSENKNLNFKHNEIDRITLGKNIRCARKENKLTQDSLAKMLKTTHSVISAYESGKTKVPTLFLIEIARITNKSLNYFLDKI